MWAKLRQNEQIQSAADCLKWAVVCLPLGIITGSLCAAFLWLLDTVTDLREQHEGLVWALPLAGAFIGILYAVWGQSVEAGNRLVIDEIHQPAGGVPLRMIPLVLAGTIVTHLFGGSAGREGTAVQMGGSAASALSRLWPRISESQMRILLMAGVAAGFGGVFGTPLAGTVFALEVLIVGRFNPAALIPCLMASVISDQCCIAWGIGHTQYAVDLQALRAAPGEENSSIVTGFSAVPVSVTLMASTVAAAVAFGLASRLFTDLAHLCQRLSRQWCSRSWLRPMIGGIAVAGLAQGFGLTDYLGLGVRSPDPEQVTIVSSFQPGGADVLSWFWKTTLTVLTVGTGFKGGEVTPLFFIGASLGNALSSIMPAPVDFLAAMGFVAVFSGATKTPIACTIMGIELFGGELTLYLAVSCCIAYRFSGLSGIYSAPTARLPQQPANDVPQSADVRAPSTANVPENSR